MSETSSSSHRAFESDLRTSTSGTSQGLPVESVIRACTAASLMLGCKRAVSMATEKECIFVLYGSHRQGLHLRAILHVIRHHVEQVEQ